ncbi:MAG TPA: hypothetical protein VED87_12475 [Methylocystis sp.]|nr:hypothetical protein [Methylocystis sp.]
MLSHAMLRRLALSFGLIALLCAVAAQQKVSIRAMAEPSAGQALSSQPSMLAKMDARAAAL